MSVDMMDAKVKELRELRRMQEELSSSGLWHMFRGSSGKNRGVLDRNGREIFPCIYDGLGYLGDGYFSVRKGADVGVMNSQGQTILPMEYAGVSHCKDTFIVSKYKSEEYRRRVAAGEGAPDAGELWTTTGVVDMNGKPLIDFGTYSVISYHKGYDYFACGKWNGQYKASDVQIVGGSTVYENVYAYDNIPYSIVKNSDGTPYVPEDGPMVVVTTPGGTITIPVPDTKPSEQTPSSSNSSSVFTDVKSTDYYADAVQWAVEKNITSGTSANTFSPGATCTNAQILAFLYRASGSPEPTISNPFADVKAADYYYKAALWAAEKGVVSGSTFGANTPCTRAATVEHIWKAAGSPAASYDGNFDDVPASADYAQAVAWALENGVTSGTSKTTFGPESTCTRGQIVTFLYRAFGK